MKTKAILLVVVMLLVGLPFAQTAFAQDDGACNIPFKATVRLGNSAGTALNGDIEFSLDEMGGLTGLLRQEEMPDIPVVGQVTGRAINLILDLSTADTPGLFVFGVGTALDPFEAGTCGTILGGPFVGPVEGDSGDWLAGYAIGGKAGNGD